MMLETRGLYLRSTDFPPLINFNTFIESAQIDSNFVKIYKDFVAFSKSDALPAYNESYVYTASKNEYVSYEGYCYKFIGATAESGATPGVDPTKWVMIFPTSLAHKQNSDTKLAEGTENEVTASQLKGLVDAAGGGAQGLAVQKIATGANIIPLAAKDYIMITALDQNIAIESVLQPIPKVMYWSITDDGTSRTLTFSSQYVWLCDPVLITTPNTALVLVAIWNNEINKWQFIATTKKASISVNVQTVAAVDPAITQTITPLVTNDIVTAYDITGDTTIIANIADQTEGNQIDLRLKTALVNGSALTFGNGYVWANPSEAITKLITDKYHVIPTKYDAARGKTVLYKPTVQDSEVITGEVVQTIVVPEPPVLNPTTQVSTINKTTTILAVNPLLNNLSLNVASGTKSKKLLIQIMGGAVEKTISLNGFSYVGHKNNLVNSNLFITVPNKLLTIECSIVIDADDNESKSVLDFSIEGVDDNLPKVQIVATSATTVAVESNANIVRLQGLTSGTFTLPNVSNPIDGFIQRVELSSANNNGTVLTYGNKFVFSGSVLNTLENGVNYTFDCCYNAVQDAFFITNLSTYILSVPTVYFNKLKGSAQGELNNPNKPFNSVALAHAALTSAGLSRANKGNFIITGVLNEVIDVMDNVCYTGNYTIGDSATIQDTVSTGKNVQIKGNISVYAPTVSPTVQVPVITYPFKMMSNVNAVIDLISVDADALLLADNGATVRLTCHGDIHVRTTDNGLGISPRGSSNVYVECKGDIYSDFMAPINAVNFSGKFILEARNIYNNVGSTNATFAYQTVIYFNNLLAGAKILIEAKNISYGGTNFVSAKTAVVSIANTNSNAIVEINGNISGGVGYVVNTVNTGAVNLTLNLNGGLASSNNYGFNFDQAQTNVPGGILTIKNGQFESTDNYIGRRRKVIFENVKLKNTSIAGSNKPIFVCQDNTVGNTTTIILRDSFLKTNDGNNSPIISGTPVGVNWYSEGRVEGTTKVGLVADSATPSRYFQVQTLDY